jgi:hypothetical protein
VNVPHVATVRKNLGNNALDVLTALFMSREGNPPSVPILRFRADNELWIDTLNELENSYSLVERSTDSKNYIVRPYALPLIKNLESDHILGIMNSIYSKFPGLYKKYLTAPIKVSLLTERVDGEKNDILEALYYLAASHGVYSGMTIGFPYAEDSTLCISESALTKKDIGQILSEYYEWHFINPKKQLNILESFGDNDKRETSGFFTDKELHNTPEWYGFLNNTQRALIWEINTAISIELEALPTIGLRTLLETIIVEKVGDEGGFRAKVERFQKGGYVTSKSAEALSHVLDAGNASAHRAYFPNKEDLVICVEVVKHLMHGIYILHPQVERVAENTPKRDGGPITSS